MTFQLTPEQEKLIGRAIQEGLIKSPEDVIDVGVETIRQRVMEHAGGAPSSPDANRWLAEFQAWVHSHTIDTPLLSDEALDRESVYGARGR